MLFWHRDLREKLKKLKKVAQVPVPGLGTSASGTSSYGERK